jgi:uncharacterized protein YjbI with pentapeptide repeats
VKQQEFFDVYSVTAQRRYSVDLFLGDNGEFFDGKADVEDMMAPEYTSVFIAEKEGGYPKISLFDEDGQGVSEERIIEKIADIAQEENLYIKNIVSAARLHGLEITQFADVAPLEELCLLPEKVQEILYKHELWLASGGKNGQRANLTGADFEGVDLRGHNLQYANLSGAILTGADLEGVDFTGANLSGADLTGADLRGCKLAGASLRDANLRGANLTGAILSGSNLMGIDLAYADLTRSNFRDANLERADLEGVDFTSANLHGAALRGASLICANFTFANLTRADLTGAILGDAALINAIGLSSAIGVPEELPPSPSLAAKVAEARDAASAAKPAPVAGRAGADKGAR